MSSGNEGPLGKIPWVGHRNDNHKDWQVGDRSIFLTFRPNGNATQSANSQPLTVSIRYALLMVADSNPFHWQSVFGYWFCRICADDDRYYCQYCLFAPGHSVSFFTSLFQHFRLIFYVLTFLSIFINWPYRIYNTHREHGALHTHTHTAFAVAATEAKENLLHFMDFDECYLWVLHTVSKRWDYVCAYQQPEQQQHHSILYKCFMSISATVSAFRFPLRLAVWCKRIHKNKTNSLRSEEEKKHTFAQCSWVRPLSPLAVATNKIFTIQSAQSFPAAASCPNNRSRHSYRNGHGNSFGTIKI